MQDNIAVKKELKNSKLTDYEYEKTLGEDTRRGQFRGGDACYYSYSYSYSYSYYYSYYSYYYYEHCYEHSVSHSLSDSVASSLTH